jgi:hypothetical protein
MPTSETWQGIASPAFCNDNHSVVTGRIGVAREEVQLAGATGLGVAFPDD